MDIEHCDWVLGLLDTNQEYISSFVYAQIVFQSSKVNIQEFMRRVSHLNNINLIKSCTFCYLVKWYFDIPTNSHICNQFGPMGLWWKRYVYFGRMKKRCYFVCLFVVNQDKSSREVIGKPWAANRPQISCVSNISRRSWLRRPLSADFLRQYSKFYFAYQSALNHAWFSWVSASQRGGRRLPWWSVADLWCLVFWPVAWCIIPAISAKYNLEKTCFQVMNSTSYHELWILIRWFILVNSLTWFWQQCFLKLLSIS